MSRPEETVLRSESGFGLKQRGDKKYRFNPPTGTLIITDMRLIFARSGEGLAKRMIAGGLLGEIGLKALTKVKPEELDKALEKPDSFQLNLQDISEVKNEKQLGLKLLSVQWSAPDNPKALFYRISTGLTMSAFDEWIKAIQEAKAHCSFQSRRAKIGPREKGDLGLVAESFLQVRCDNCGTKQP